MYSLQFSTDILPMTKVEYLVGISEPQVTHLQKQDPYIQVFIFQFRIMRINSWKIVILEYFCTEMSKLRFRNIRQVVLTVSIQICWCWR